MARRSIKAKGGLSGLRLVGEAGALRSECKIRFNKNVIPTGSLQREVPALPTNLFKKTTQKNCLLLFYNKTKHNYSKREMVLKILRHLALEKKTMPTAN